MTSTDDGFRIAVRLCGQLTAIGGGETILLVQQNMLLMEHTLIPVYSRLDSWISKAGIP